MQFWLQFYFLVLIRHNVSIKLVAQKASKGVQRMEVNHKFTGNRCECVINTGRFDKIATTFASNFVDLIANVKKQLVLLL